MNPKTSAEKLDESLGIDGGGTGSGVGRLAEAYRLASELVDRPRGVSGTSGAKCPADRRIEAFLNDYFSDLRLPSPLRLPGEALVLPRHGLARVLSLPYDADIYGNDYVRSYRVRNGVLHNPRSDRRTTQGMFHVAEGGLPIPADKKAVPRPVFAALLRHARSRRRPSCWSSRSPPTGREPLATLRLAAAAAARLPRGPRDLRPRRRMEIRFFAPGSLVSNLDFVESIFGNAGDPYLPENDAGLDVEHWTGHTGCVILAPHLTRLAKKDLGLPHWDEATERQRRDGMCWRDPDELYNDGRAFKITCRDAAGVIVTLIADNYFGYCKKEVKTQISFAANLFGLAEEEHAGGALAFASYDLGDEFDAERRTVRNARARSPTWCATGRRASSSSSPRATPSTGCYPDIVYVPETRESSVHRPRSGGRTRAASVTIPLPPGQDLHDPLGLQGPDGEAPAAPRAGGWSARSPRALFCHKPCTVSRRRQVRDLQEPRATT